jgi:glucose/arabinose dehydrogenase
MKLFITRAILSFSAVAAFVLVSAASPQQNAGQIQEFATDSQTIRVVPIAQGLESPWSMTFLPGGDILSRSALAG